MRISDWSSDVCSSDLSSARCARACFGVEDFTARCLQPGNLDVEILVDGADAGVADAGHGHIRHIRVALPSYSNKIGRASCRERVCQYVSISVVAVALKKKQNICTSSHNYYKYV